MPLTEQGRAARDVYVSIIDQELDAADLIEKQVARLDVTAGRLRKLARKVYRMRLAGEIGKRDARVLFVRGYVAALIAEYAHDIKRIKALVDGYLETQVEAVRRLDVPLSKLKPITDIEIKERATERAAERAGIELSVQNVGTSGACVDILGATSLATINGRLKGPGRGKLPDLSGIKDKSPEALERTLSRFGLEPDLKEFERRAVNVYRQQLEAAIEEKGFPDKDTWTAIDKQLERAAVQTLRQQVKTTVQSYRHERLKTVSKWFIWIAVGHGSCPSCIRRHGKRKTMRQWEAAGIPGSAVLICQRECRCSLQPDLIGEEELDVISEVVDEALEGLNTVTVQAPNGR